MLSDGLFFKDIQNSVDLFSKYSDQPVYYYEFAHNGQYSLTQFFGPSAAMLKGDILFNADLSNITSRTWSTFLIELRIQVWAMQMNLDFYSTAILYPL